MKRVFLDSNFLFSKEVMPFQGNELSYTYPAPNDIPKEIDVTPSQGGNDVAMRFVYGDREEAGVEETVLDSEADSPIHLILGRYSGKLMSLRVSGNKEGVPAVAERGTRQGAVLVRREGLGVKCYQG